VATNPAPSVRYGAIDSDILFIVNDEGH
jgi:hypothetical protein